MMFLQYCVPGALLPILSLYLKDRLHFAPFQVGEILAIPAMAAFVAPVIAASIADRIISAERFLALSHFLGAGLMLWLSYQTSFGSFLLVYLAYALLFTPTSALTNTVTFHHAEDAKRDFSPIRLWGTAGWFAVGWVFGYFWVRNGGSGAEASRLPDAFKLSALCSLLVAAYALTLPRSHVITAKAAFAPWKGWRTFTRPSLLLLCALTFFNVVVNQFYLYGISPYLSHIGFRDQYIMPAMSLGQLTEIGAMAYLGRFLSRFGLKSALIIGAGVQLVRSATLAWGGPDAVILCAVALHGICYTFFFAVAFIYVDQHSARGERASAQQLFAVIFSGVGTLAGSLLAGKVAEALAARGSGAINYTGFWMVPALLSVLVTLLLALFFREEPAPRAT
ncbi:MAG: MFS transporter [Candidatus Hydrogenedentes bacterium]|nr:MFS transporter [Candidatus Hydrogenedentota bacterium]